MFSNPPGPTALTGQAAKAMSTPSNTENGSLDVDYTLATEDLARTDPYLRVISHLKPSTDLKHAPILKSWNLTFDCLPGI